MLDQVFALTRRHLRAGALLLVAALTGCAAPGPPRPVGPHTVELSKVPFFPQDSYQCGPASLAEVLSFTGVPVHPEALEPYLYLPARKGTLQAEMIAQARRHGRLVYPIEGSIAAVTAEVAAGHPVLVLQNLAFSWWPIWHYSVVVGFDPDARTVILRSGEQARHQEPYELFRRTWTRAKRWGIVVLPPGQLPATATAHNYLQAAAALEQVAGARTALPAYRAGVTHWPDSAPLWIALANGLQAQGDLDGAEHALRAALDHDPSNAIAYNNLAMVLADRGRWSEALAAVHHAIALGGPFLEQFRNTLTTIRCRQRGDCPSR